MRRPVAIAVLALALLGLSGCKGACRQLSEKLCDCNTNSVEKELCVQRAANDESYVEPTSEDEAVCEQKLDTCDCGTIDTDEGKVACGLAR
ncbi:hypothetical protein [Hyalangium versicolor]|uniref:hypothetical protein n=1 Tax=Hyalangium versicolor TaxID=2861190 RepID=UPI001CCB2167|nr:hypothetical protein [Hyalangium versicolor]